MDYTVFDMFPETPYTFLQLSNGGVLGNGVIAKTNATGIFKDRRGLLQTPQGETPESTSTLHIHPTESFITAVAGELEQHGILRDGLTYRIVGMTGGFNFETNVLEHYRLTLKREDYSYGE